MNPRLPWEVVETFPTSDAELVGEWDQLVHEASNDAELTHALTGRALANYWAAQEGVVHGSWAEVWALRRADVRTSVELARSVACPDTLARALLGELYALWGPDHAGARDGIVTELLDLWEQVSEEELRLRILEWSVLRCLDSGDLDSAEAEVARFAAAALDTDLVLFRRREELWHANVAMMRGRIDEAVRINQDAISSTADTAGSPFSFQNVAITLAIERFLRRGLADLVDAIRSIRASSPRVAANWDTGLAFALAESGATGEAAELFDTIAANGFEAVPRDLNWLVTMQLLALVALHLDDRPRIDELFEQLSAFSDSDATHGSGYASYGPVGRVVAKLAARRGRRDLAATMFDSVLASRAPGPWTSLTRLDRAIALEESNPEQALADALRAEDELRSFGMQEWSAVARQLMVRLRLDGHGDPIALRRSGSWILRHCSGTANVPDGVGMGQLIELLGRPGVTMKAVELDTHVDPRLPGSSSSAPTLDQEARGAYRNRLAALESRTGALTDTELAEEQFLRRELAGSAWAPASSAELDKARVRVTKAIRRAVDSLAAQSPTLGVHLAESVSTGRHCAYTPADGIGWEVVRES